MLTHEARMRAYKLLEQGSSSWLDSLLRKIDIFYCVFKLTGLRGLLLYKPLPAPILTLLKRLGLNLKDKFAKLHLRGYSAPVFLRYGSTDHQVFHQIFLLEEYACLTEIDPPALIFDCGANVGYSSLYLLNQYPNARIVAVEPDSENFRLCKKNLAPYKGSVLLIQSGVWSHATGLKVCPSPEGEWAVQVEECQADQLPDLYAVSIEDLLHQSGASQIDLLKVDIEGSEAVVFSTNTEGWLPTVKNIVIELHGEACEAEFFRAMKNYRYLQSTFGELTVCRSITSRVE